MPGLLTLGHGTATAQELAELFRTSEIDSVVDVRTIPRSRCYPQFWRAEMERSIPEMSDGKLHAHIPTAGVRTTAESLLRYDALPE